MTKPSRRSFLKGAVTTTAAAFVSRHASAAAAAAPAVRTRLTQFDYADVQLLDGPMLEQFRTNHAFFLALNDDSLLQPFRQKAGLPAPGEEMGGWYSWSKDFDPPHNMTGYVPGHTFGQYMSGLARAYAATGDRPTQEKIARLVRGYAETISPNFWTNYCLPAYTSDKVTCGLIDAHQFAHDPMALKVLAHATDTVLPFLPPHALTRPEMAARPHENIAWTWDESYTLPENFFLAYERSGDPRYLDLAKRFLQDQDYFDPLAEGRNVLPGEHAYSHVNALSSASQAYLVLASEKHLRAARNGFDFVRNTQSFATGGWGPNETFRAPGSGDMGKSLTETHASFETPCGAYGHFKIARYLMRVTGDSRYGDSMEQVLYNTILGALPILPDGTSFYYSDYNDSGSKFRHPDKWPCCSGTFPQITADYGISSYFHDGRDVFVNLYVPSRLNWQPNGAHFGIEQTTQYPYTSEVTLRIHADRPEAFGVNLRIPAWAGAGTRIAVNGGNLVNAPRPGAFLPIRRTWKDGDRVEIEFDMPQRLEAVDPQHPETVALVRGPLCLFAIDPGAGSFTRRQLMAAVQQSAGSNSWSVQTSGAPATFRSFPAIQQGEKYRLYHQIQS
ncbi:MAG TPA: beta-L-arabinofuranosidase domain-containing protein [Acidobacteriaceae bacterium]|nr:beta-L-arabinofuranosidase domain-containing protein [Acidobacteriaceae bacterium]